MNLNKDLRESKMKINVIGKLSSVFINQFQLSMLLMIMIISIGVVGLISLPKESLPEIVFPAITIQTVYPGASPEDVERLVTEKIEKKVKDFEDIDTIESDSTFGFSVITVSFKESVNIENKKIEVDNALREIEFSEGVLTPKSVIFKTSEIPLMNISVNGDYDVETLTQIAENLKNELESIKGVDSIDLFGTTVKEVHIITDENKMLTYNITLSDIKNAIKSSNISLPVGDSELNGVRYTLRVDESFKALDEIKDVVVVGRSGQQIFIKDLAKVSFGVAPVSVINKTFIRDQMTRSQNSIFMKVNRKVNSDVLGTSEAIENKIQDLKGISYPEDAVIYISDNMARRVGDDLANIQSSALSGLIVVIIVLFLFIGIRESLIVSITIPLSLLGTLGLLNLFGITFNTFAILGLIVALGLLVDNSIIVMENIDRIKKLGFNRKEAAFLGTNQVGFPIVSATLTTLAAFFPLVILPGILGAFVSTIPLTIMITLTVSLFVSLVITPSIASRLLKNQKHHSIGKIKWLKNSAAILLVAGLSYYAFSVAGNRLLALVMMAVFTGFMALKIITIGDEGFEDTRVTRFYGTIVAWIVYKKRRSFLVLFVGGLLLVMSVSAFGTGLLKVSFFPKNEPDTLEILVDTPGGTTLSQNEQIASEIEEMLLEHEAVKSYNVTVGGNEIDFVKFSVAIDNSLRSGYEILEGLQEQTAKVSGAEISINGIAAGPPVGKPIVLKVEGENLEDTYKFSNEVSDYLRNLEGVYNIDASVTVGVPQIKIGINKLKATQLGTNVSTVALQLRGELGGVEATTMRINEDEVDVIIKRDSNEIDDLGTLKSLFIATQNGMMVPLRSISDIQIEEGISNISREDGKRVITVSADLKTGYNSSDITNTIKRHFDESKLPKGIRIIYSGDSEGIQENFGYLFQSMILAVFLVFIILTVQFQSIIQPFVILSTIPMSIIGVIWGLILTGNDFGFYAFMGLVALVGIAVNDAIVLIDYMNYLRKEGATLKEAIKEAGLTRFNPVLATTLTTISGVLPLAFKEAYYAQFSFALIFGLMMTTLMTLIFIPTIYHLIESFRDRKGVETYEK
ncbi:efflux RND transporter permease subunit [Fusibacter ferrireducens]|uniref:Efflux RND transporter permease subunit n=1 Tax=Fusibacter ferrireducens TaxID=2785058 RepID=A0ABR9ZS43_9FIRM|nr:efflux RND transporter permease subunit [Fusibacter ferrireducens]MBF4692730.1 efflux RND transporter permease subunit [Fusibacter ferrireducens]